MQFHETVMGTMFYNKQLPELINGVKRLADALECNNKQISADNTKNIPALTVQEYNRDFIPKYEGAYCFICNIPHAIEKSPVPDETEKQFRCTGWNEQTKKILLDALEFYKEYMVCNLKTTSMSCEEDKNGK